QMGRRVRRVVVRVGRAFSRGGAGPGGAGATVWDARGRQGGATWSAARRGAAPGHSPRRGAERRWPQRRGAGGARGRRGRGAGGEPEVFADTLHGRLIYTSHEGTTHLYRDGLVMSPWGDFSFVSNYCNQVNIWTSPDGGANWYRDRYLGSPCPTSPAINTGFS